MSLIEQLGLDFAKKIYKENLEDFFGDASGVKVNANGLRFTHEELSEALLQYRREHNIFEEFDYIVDKVKTKDSELMQIHFFYCDDAKWCCISCVETGGTFDDVNTDDYKHASDEEIEAGHIL